ncbi:MAG: hypothetical protein WAQ27_03185 [Candidatus Microsaccharimonas sp.]
MSHHATLPRVIWANRLEQRALRIHNVLRQPRIDPGHYLYAVSTADSHELPAVRFNRIALLDTQTILTVLKRSQDAVTSPPRVVEFYNGPSKRMFHIAGLMSEERQRKFPHRSGPRLTQEDFIVGILLSGSEVVNELLLLQGIEVNTLLRQLNITLAPNVRELLLAG